jgi:hypothetical protein
MNTPQPVQDRDALYYPYIHIRDVNWLKATLLCFPQVRRIIPHEFTLNDSAEVSAFRELQGARGQPLLGEEPAYSLAAYEAQTKLLARIQGMDPKVRKKFNFQATAADFDGATEKFQIHRGKLEPLLTFLESEQLAWPAREMRGPAYEWYAVHPKLGEAIMAVLAIAIARNSGLDIVTSEGRIHKALRTLDAEMVFQELAGQKSDGGGATAEDSVTDKTDQLAQVFMLTRFDFSRLTPKQIEALVRDGKDLLTFKARISAMASSIPEIADEAQRRKRFEDAAKQIQDEWQKYRKSLPKFALEAILSVADYKTPEIAMSALAGATSTVAVSLGGGLIVGLGIFAGVRAWQAYKEKASSPYAFLSRIEKAGAVLATPGARREGIAADVMAFA